MRIFVTGASGWIGSATVPELLAAGHSVVGLARSDASAAAVATAGAEVVRGGLDDLEVLARAAAAADGVIHLAYDHGLAFTGAMQGAADADLAAVAAMGEVLAGSDRPLLIASGVLGLAPGRLATEQDMPGLEHPRVAGARAALALADRGVRSGVVRLAPTVHGDGDHGFVPTLIAVARDRGVSAYVGDGSNRWPAIHRADAARLFRLALETAPAGSILHATAEDGVAARDIAEAIGRHLDLPVGSVAAEEAVGHFGWIGGLWAADSLASSALTRALLGWAPTHPGLLADLDAGHYFSS